MSDVRPELPLSKQPEMIRANQKDEEYTFRTHSHFLEALEIFVPRFLSYRALSHHKHTLTLLSSLLYYGLTTLSNRNTLGEEFSNIGQYNESDFEKFGKLITLKRKIIFVLLKTFVSWLAQVAVRGRFNL